MLPLNYEKALKELKESGYAGFNYNPHKELELLSIELGSSFIVYSIIPEAVLLEIIYVAEEDRGQGIGTKLLELLKVEVLSKPSWPRSIRAEVFAGNIPSENLFKDFRDRLVQKEMTI